MAPPSGGDPSRRRVSKAANPAAFRRTTAVSRPAQAMRNDRPSLGDVAPRGGSLPAPDTFISRPGSFLDNVHGAALEPRVDVGAVHVLDTGAGMRVAARRDRPDQIGNLHEAVREGGYEAVVPEFG